MNSPDIDWRRSSAALCTITHRVAMLWAALVASALLLVAAPLSAASRNCAGLSEPSRKVLFGQPTVEGGTGIEAQSLREGLLYAFDSTRETGWIEPAADPVEFLFCDDTGLASSAELSKAIANDLYAQKVVLEIRAKLDVGTGTGKKATLQYVSIPTLYNFKNGQTTAQGILWRSFSIDPAGNFVDAYTRPHDIDAFVAAGLGVRYLDERKYDWAWQNLCKANEYIDSIMKETADPLAPKQKRNLESLRAFIDTSLKQTIKAGKNLPSGTIAFAAIARKDLEVNPCSAKKPEPQP